ncbi:hypothetical protein [Amycolatopsis sp. WGS_07]|uniref:hypothetical protein n=1 Tax=Amycolatopsis sp. WGS_07 TaxID=3076764 RepID=UPI003873577A
MPEAEAQASAWLRSRKDYDVPLNVSADYAQHNSTLSVRRLADNGRHDLRVRLVEDQGASGTWTTDLIAHDEPGDRDWISLTVRNDQGRFVNVPGLAKFLVEALPLRDGSIEFSGRPEVFREQDIDRLVSLLADERRHGLVLVAGSESADGLPFDPYVRKVGEWSQEVCGLAEVAVLDPAATRAFALMAGDRYRVPAWTIRTYRPGVVFEDEKDHRRHRILGTQRLAQHPDSSIRRLLGEIVREQAAARPANPEVLRVQRRFDRHENRRLVEAVETAEFAPAVGSSAPTKASAAIDVRPAVEPSSAEMSSESALKAEIAERREQLALVRRVLGIASVTEHELAEAMTRITVRHADREAIRALELRVDNIMLANFGLEDQNEKLRNALDEAQTETEIVQLELDDSKARIQWLETRLKERGDYESPYVDVPEDFGESVPEDFEDLLQRLEQIHCVVFTGDPAEVAKLNQIDTNNAALRTAWESVLCLKDYVAARKCGDWNGGLDQYLTNPPSGYRSVGKKKWGRSENRSTMNAWGEERVFPVPEDVDPSRRMAMTSHFKLAKIGMRSPRMYVYDAHPRTPCVYIGYIGVHLTNTQTN